MESVLLWLYNQAEWRLKGSIPFQPFGAMSVVIDNTLSHVRNKITDEASINNVGATIYINEEIDQHNLDDLDGDEIDDQTLEVVEYATDYAVIKLRNKTPVTF
jgi:hypothetical protein